MKRKTPDYAGDLNIYIYCTVERFDRLFEEARVGVNAAYDAGTMDKAVKGLTPREYMEEVMAIQKARHLLMEHGWLPPREKDVLERGTLGFATKWTLDRQYEPSDFSYKMEKVYFKEAD